MNAVNIKGQQFPAIEAGKLESGMIYWDGSGIDSVVIGAKTVRFVLAGSVERTVRACSMIALAHEQTAVAQDAQRSS